MILQQNILYPSFSNQKVHYIIASCRQKNSPTIYNFHNYCILNHARIFIEIFIINAHIDALLQFFFGLYTNRRIFIHIYLLILSLRLRTKARMPKFTDSKCFFKFKKVILVHESLLRGSKPLLALLLLTLQKIYILYSIHKIFLREIDFTKVNCISIVVFS